MFTAQFSGAILHCLFFQSWGGRLRQIWGIDTTVIAALSEFFSFYIF